jgi:hypothetical protein
MDKLRTLSKSDQVVLGAAGLLFIDSFFGWYSVNHTSYSENMWHGMGFIAGLALLAILAWVGLRIAGIKVELGSISHSMVTAGLSVLLLLFVVIRVLSKPGNGFTDSLISRSIWLWIGLILAIGVVAGAWMGMQAAGESLSDVRDKVSSMTSSGGSSSAATTPAPPAAQAPEAPAAPAPPVDEPSGGDGSEHSS